MDKPGITPAPGRCDRIAPGVRRITAPNPSMMTAQGTNSYLLGEGDVALVDPGPDSAAHQAALLDALAPGERITHILVTHSHADHSRLCPAIAAATGAPVYAFGDSATGRPETMSRIAGLGGGEGVDAGFAPDARLAHGARLSVGGLEIEALHTPGHFGNHMCFAAGGVLFSGDLVMGWSSTMISPPDGEIGAFFQSCALLRARPETLFLPGHGAAIADPAARIDWLVAHRQARAVEIRDALRAGPASAQALAERIYAAHPPATRRAGARSVLAHLIDMMTENIVAPDSEPTAEARFRLL